MTKDQQAVADILRDEIDHARDCKDDARYYALRCIAGKIDGYYRGESDVSPNRRPNLADAFWSAATGEMN